MKELPFTNDSYRSLVGQFTGKGYKVVDFPDADPSEKHLILRHDIDFSLAKARRLASIEADLGVPSIYFVLVTSEFYNVFSSESRKHFDFLTEHGREIGLHFDASLYPSDNASLDEASQKECEVLELATGQKIRVVSFHRPARNLLGREETLAGRIHTYQPRFYSEMGYSSDSKGGWHHGTPLESEAFINSSSLQLLTHPIWWEDQDRDPQEKLDDFLQERDEFMKQETARNCVTYKPKSKGK